MMRDWNNVIPFCVKKRKAQTNDMETVYRQQDKPDVRAWELIPEMTERIPADKLEETIKFKNTGIPPHIVFPADPEREAAERVYLEQFIQKD